MSRISIFIFGSKQHEVMEDVLENLRKNEDKDKSSAAIHLLKVYINNVVKNPSNIKYRKIRISNAKFHSVIWSVEAARSFLLLAGFEENGDFLVLPERTSLDGAKIFLDNIATDDGLSSSETKTPQASSDMQRTSGNLLRLRKSTDSSMFDEVVKADMTLLSYMKEMGYDVSVAEKALIITKNKGIQPAMDWIDSNPTKVDKIIMAAFKKLNESSKIPESESGLHPRHAEQPTVEGAPVSRFQATIDERHKFQEKLRLEAIESARLEKAEQKRQKEYLLKNLEDEKRERREKSSERKKEPGYEVVYAIAHVIMNSMENLRFDNEGYFNHSKAGQLLLAFEQGKIVRMYIQPARKTGQGIGERIKCMRTCEAAETVSSAGAGETSDQSTTGEESDHMTLKLRLPDGKVTTMKAQSQNPLGSIYNHITSISDLKEEDFIVMTISPQRKLTEKEKSIGELGLRSQETLIIQRVNQISTLTQGHGEICQVLEITVMDEWATVLQENSDKLIVVEFYVTWSAECKRGAQQFESLNAEYGVNKKVLFMRVNTDLIPDLKGEYRINILPMYKLLWNKKTLCDVHGVDREKLNIVIRENEHGPGPERVNDDMCADYFDPR